MCKRTMHKRARNPMFLRERRACANSVAQAVFPRPRKNGLGTRLVLRATRYPFAQSACACGYAGARTRVQGSGDQTNTSVASYSCCAV